MLVRSNGALTSHEEVSLDADGGLEAGGSLGGHDNMTSPARKSRLLSAPVNLMLTVTNDPPSGCSGLILIEKPTAAGSRAYSRLLIS